MKKTLSTALPYAVILAAAFYLLPWLARSTGAAMLVMLFVIPLACFACAAVYGRRHGFGLILPVMTVLLFAPTVLIYYNSTAWPYIAAYGGIALAGTSAGHIFHKR